LNAQIDGISEFLRLGRDKMSQGNIDMTEAVQMVVEELEPRTRDRKLKIEVYPLPNAFGDAAMIRRVWMSLLDNAAKFTASKGEAKIEVGALSDDKTETVYFVRDNGVGFDMQFAGRLFGVFNRLHGDDFPGDGTGLAIARRIVSRHGGRVWAEGKPDEGATFYFALPASETGHG
jgi:light-regulated signal transduction histidine kinase (bacteriophytochrome)